VEVKLVNVDVNPIFVDHQNGIFLLNKGESVSFSQYDKFDFRLRHFKSDSNNSMMYMATALISYEQDRIEFTVDGEYRVEPQEENVLIKVKSYEYVFDKNISYNIFVFNCNSASIKCTKYFVPKREDILRKCRMLYLFGGKKTFFPICLFLFVVSFCCVLLGIRLFENILFLIGSGISAVLLGRSYIRSLRVLRESSEEEKIRAYMNSERTEYRTKEDDMVQRNLDKDLMGEKYW